eukprot:1157370-Pelagomonas_calceolata.AAC.3
MNENAACPLVLPTCLTPRHPTRCSTPLRSGSVELPAAQASSPAVGGGAGAPAAPVTAVVAAEVPEAWAKTREVCKRVLVDLALNSSL